MYIMHGGQTQNEHDTQNIQTDACTSRTKLSVILPLFINLQFSLYYWVLLLIPVTGNNMKPGFSIEH